MKTLVAKDHHPEDFICLNYHFKHSDLVQAADRACPHIFKATDKLFPARYDGDLFEEYGKQRYVFPIFENRLYSGTQGKYFLPLSRQKKN